MLLLWQAIAISVFIVGITTYTVVVVSTACVMYIIIFPFTGRILRLLDLHLFFLKGSSGAQRVCMHIADMFWGTLVFLFEKWGR